MVIELTGGATSVTLPPYGKRCVARRWIVRLMLAAGGAGAGGFFSFWALAGVRKRAADNKAETNDAISSAFGLFTEADCAGEGKSLSSERGS